MRIECVFVLKLSSMNLTEVTKKQGKNLNEFLNAEEREKSKRKLWTTTFTISKLVFFDFNLHKFVT